MAAFSPADAVVDLIGLGVISYGHAFLVERTGFSLGLIIFTKFTMLNL